MRRHTPFSNRPLMTSGSICSFSSISLTFGPITSSAYRLTNRCQLVRASLRSHQSSPVSLSIFSSSVKFHKLSGVSMAGRVISSFCCRRVEEVDNALARCSRRVICVCLGRRARGVAVLTAFESILISLCRVCKDVWGRTIEVHFTIHPRVGRVELAKYSYGPAGWS
jgi:hypothetical protein